MFAKTHIKKIATHFVAAILVLAAVLSVSPARAADLGELKSYDISTFTSKHPVVSHNPLNQPLFRLISEMSGQLQALDVAPDPVSDLYVYPFIVPEAWDVDGVIVATLVWSEPYNGGSAITDYELHVSSDEFDTEDLVCGDTILCDVDMGVAYVLLDNFEVEYSFQIYAINAEGTSPGSSVISATFAEPGIPADGVLGQFNSFGNPSFTQGDAYSEPTTELLAMTPYSAVIDQTNHLLYVSDFSNDRILRFALNDDNQPTSALPDIVIGQPDLETTQNGLDANSLTGPWDVTLDDQRDVLYIADGGNGRVLIYDNASLITESGASATRVFGADGFTSAGNCNQTAYDLCGDFAFMAIALDVQHDRLYVSDSVNGRVLAFADASTSNSYPAAARVIGKSGFSETHTPLSSATQTGFYAIPMDLAYDPALDRLFVADMFPSEDEANPVSRVLEFDSISTANNMPPAYRVFGQTSFTSTNATGITPTSSNLAYPFSLSFDSESDRLFATDLYSTSNGYRSRVVVYENTANALLTGEAADFVLGQPDMTTRAAPETLGLDYALPLGTLYDSTSQRLLVSDVEQGVIVAHDFSDGIQNYEPYEDFFEPTSELVGEEVGMSDPVGIDVDTFNHLLYVTDADSYRVLVYQLDDSNELVDLYPDYVVGKNDIADVTSNSTNTFGYPTDVQVDAANGLLYVSDLHTHTIAVFSTANLLDMAYPTHRLGDYLGYNPGTSDSTLNSPSGLAYDAEYDRLFVADRGNHRVLVFEEVSTLSNGAAASHAIGQPTFNNVSPNYGEVSTTQYGFSAPDDVAFDSINEMLFVTDRDNHRILAFSAALNDFAGAGQYYATGVLGQTDFVSDSSGTTQDHLNAPTRLALDEVGGRLWVSDINNGRVAEYNIREIIDGELIDAVYGQDTFISDAIGITTQSHLSIPVGTVFDPTTERLYVVDSDKNRVLWWNVPAPESPQLIPETVLGQFDDLAEPSFTMAGSYGQPSPLGPGGTSHSAVYDSAGHRLFVSDTLWTCPRVLVYELNADNSLVDRVADFVIGQESLTSCTEAITQSTLYIDYGEIHLAFDPNRQRLFVSDNADRVLVFDLEEGITNGMDAQYVIGNDDYIDAESGVQANRFAESIYDLEYDSLNDRLFVADQYRVMVFDGADINTNMSIDYALLQATHTSNDIGVSNTLAEGPRGLAYSESLDLLFVSDTYNNRVLVFDGTPTELGWGSAAINVLGQPSFWDNMGNEGGSVQAHTLVYPLDLETDDINDRLYIQDSGNARIVVHELTPALESNQSAVAALGQENLVTQNYYSSDLSGLQQETHFLAHDPLSGMLAVSTHTGGLGRVQFFDVNDVVTGEPAVDYISAAGSGFSAPSGVTVDTVGHRLFVTSVYRVLVYELDDNNELVDLYPDKVIGTHHISAHFPINSLSISALSYPGGSAFDALHGLLYVADSLNSRVLVYDIGFDMDGITDGMDAVRVFGQPDFEQDNAWPISETGIGFPGSVAVDAVGDRLFVTDIFSHRVLVFEGASSLPNNAAASRVIGQLDFTASDTGDGAAQLNAPTTVAYDSEFDRLFVSDAYNHRVMVYDASDISTFGESAMNVIGQLTLTGGCYNQCDGSQPDASTLYYPVSLSYDESEQRLAVTDIGNNRALIYDLSDGITNGMSAVQVIGQPDFETATPGGDATQNNIAPLTDDALFGTAFGGGKLYLADSLYHRVLVFDLGGSSSGGSRGGSGDIYPPTLHEIESAPLSTSEMRLTWVTNEASDSVVRYGLTSSYGHTTTEPAFVTSHIVGLANLSPSTTYHFQVCSNDSFYNLGCSEDMTFTTPSIGEVIPEIGEDGEEESLWVPEYDAQGHSTGMFTSGPSFTGLGVTVSDVTRDSVTITWTTDEASGTHVEYGTGIPYSHDKVVDGLVTTHTVRLTGLSSGTTYHFRVASQGTDAMRSVSEDYTFTTR